MSDSQESKPLLDLSDLRLAPKWVADFGKATPSSAPDFEESSSSRPRRPGPGQGGQGQGRGDFRGRGPGAGGPRPGQDQRGGAGPRGPRDGGGGGYRGGGQGQGQGQGQGFGQRSRDGRPPRQDGRGGPQGRRDFRDRDQDQRQPYEAPVRAPEGLHAEIEPESRAVEAMSAMIRNAGKAYSVFDAARLVLSSGDRYHVKFSLPKDSTAKLYAIPADGSLWLSREEAIEHFLNSDGIKEFYQVEQVQLEAPKGNFTSIAICGMTGELLGPPSHHSYQSSLHRIHREKFPHMSFEDYKRRVRTDNNPETVEKWKESLTHGTYWIPVTPGSEPEAAAPAPAAIVPAPAVEAQSAADAEAPAAIEGAETETEAEGAEPEVAAAESEAAVPPPTPVEDTRERLKSRAEMQAHFRANFAPTLVHETSTRYVAGNIPKQNIHPALYQVLRRTVDETRKHLLALAQRLCVGFEQHGLKLFKRRGGKLWVSRTRPRLLDSTVVLSERISLMMQIVKAQPGITNKALVEAVAPSAAKAAPAPAPAAAEASTAAVPEVAAAPESEAIAPATVEELATTQAVATESLTTPEELPAIAATATAESNAAQLGALKDLHWLHSEGYVIEYADGQVYPGVTEPPPAKPKAEKPAPAVAIVEGEGAEVTASSGEAAIAEAVAAKEAVTAPVEEIVASETEAPPLSEEAVASTDSAESAATATEAAAPAAEVTTIPEETLAGTASTESAASATEEAAPAEEVVAAESEAVALPEEVTAEVASTSIHEEEAATSEEAESLEPQLQASAEQPEKNPAV